MTAHKYVKLVKLVTGEQVICELRVLWEECQDPLFGARLYEMKNCAKVILSPDGVKMIPLCPFSKEDVLSVKHIHVVFTAKPELELVNAYINKFGSSDDEPAEG
jgi:hypothetical protein